MQFQIECPKCRSIFISRETELGAMIFCPECNYTFEVGRKFVIEVK